MKCSERVVNRLAHTYKFGKIYLYDPECIGKLITQFTLQGAMRRPGDVHTHQPWYDDCLRRCNEKDANNKLRCILLLGRVYVRMSSTCSISQTTAQFCMFFLSRSYLAKIAIAYHFHGFQNGIF